MPQLRQQALITSFLSSLLAALLALPLLLLAGPAAAGAAEVLQISGPDRVLVGDRNRTSAVQLACVAVIAGSEQQARDLLRQRLPRNRRINLRPIGEHDGVLVARISPLGDPSGDLSDALVAAGLAEAVPCS